MSNLDPRVPALILFVIEAAIYLSVIAMLLRRRAGRASASYLMSLYAGIALLLQGSEAAWRADLLGGMSATALHQLHWYGTLVLAFLLVLVVRSFLQLGGIEGWLAAGIVWLIVLLLLASNIFQLPEILWSDAVNILSLEQLIFGVAVIGWAVFNGSSTLIVREAHRTTTEPLHRNRITYWLPILVFMISADMLFIQTTAVWGGMLRLIGAWLAAYALVTHHLPDVQQIMRSVLIYVVTTLLTIFFYIVAVTFSLSALPGLSAYNPLYLGAAIALLLALIFRPLLAFIERTVDRWLGIDKLDAGRTINEYTQSISNILDMERLANVAVGLIMEVMDIQRGFLFLVDQENDEENQKYYRLRAVRSAGERPINAGLLTVDGAVAKYLTREQRPLLQYDIDLLPSYQQSPVEERKWLKRLNAEIYVPIFAKREWIGLFAFGGKLSGNRYSAENQVTLSALAGQTAVALENARLVENLIQLNQEVRQAYSDLDEANQNLERIDRTKSDFISIASHELRTPLTVIRGYSEMLLENDSLDSAILQMLKGIHDGSMRLHEIMDSLFDIAQIDARTLELHLQNLDVAELIRGVCGGLAKPISERKQMLTIDLPSLPSIKADPNTLRKVFYHVINNAVKFTPDAGKIAISGHSIPSNMLDMPDGGVEIIISDTGVGVDPTFREVIFTKFYQPGEQLGKHSTGKTKFKGSGAGLGLALSRGIVEAHGGKIWVESSGYDDVHFPGSKFHVTLPLRRQNESETLSLSESVQIKM